MEIKQRVLDSQMLLDVFSFYCRLSQYELAENFDTSDSSDFANLQDVTTSLACLLENYIPHDDNANPFNVFPLYSADDLVHCSVHPLHIKFRYE